MKEVVVTGVGKVGATIARLLASADYDVILADRSPDVLGQTEPHPRIHTYVIDIAEEEKLRQLVHGKFAITNAARSI